MRQLIHRTAVGTVLVSSTVLAVLGSPAAAHSGPEPAEAPSSSEQSIGFTVGRGCDGSPTVQLDMRLPDGIADPIPEPPDGWTGSVAENVVTFTGGPLPDTIAATFRVRITLPASAGPTVCFPIAQRCEAGEIRWNEVPIDVSGNDLDEPAPALLLSAAAPTTPGPPDSSNPAQRRRRLPSGPTTTARTEPSTTTSTSTAPSSSAPPSTQRSDTTVVPVGDGGDDDGGSAAGTLVFIGAVVAVAIVAALAIRQTRRRA